MFTKPKPHSLDQARVAQIQLAAMEEAARARGMEDEVARITVGGILFRGDQILLGKRSADRAYYPGAWDAPGGHCEEGETPEQTLVRELREELGIIPVEYRLLAILPEPKPEIHGEGSHHLYLVTNWNGVPRNLREEEHSELAWVRLEELERLELAIPSDHPVLQSIRCQLSGE